MKRKGRKDDVRKRAEEAIAKAAAALGEKPARTYVTRTGITIRVERDPVTREITGYRGGGFMKRDEELDDAADLAIHKDKSVEDSIARNVKAAAASDTNSMNAKRPRPRANADKKKTFKTLVAEWREMHGGKRPSATDIMNYYAELGIRAPSSATVYKYLREL